MMIGKRIQARRKQLGMSADELGKRLGKDRSTIYRYEKGDIENLPLDILEPIAYALETTPQYLMGWEETQQTNNIISDVTLRMMRDSEFFAAVTFLNELSTENMQMVLDLSRGLWVDETVSRVRKLLSLDPNRQSLIEQTIDAFLEKPVD